MPLSSTHHTRCLFIKQGNKRKFLLKVCSCICMVFIYLCKRTCNFNIFDAHSEFWGSNEIVVDFKGLWRYDNEN